MILEAVHIIIPVLIIITAIIAVMLKDLIAAAIAVARNLDIDWSIIKNALKTIKLTGLRSEFKEVEGIKFINDCYNANPLSMKNAIKMLKDIDGNNKIAVLGDMLELGEIKEAAQLTGG